jgi:hypothetical protein
MATTATQFLFSRQPRTGDMQQMLEDISRVEKTPKERFTEHVISSINQAAFERKSLLDLIMDQDRSEYFPLRDRAPLIHISPPCETFHRSRVTIDVKPLPIFDADFAESITRAAQQRLQQVAEAFCLPRSLL